VTRIIWKHILILACANAALDRPEEASKAAMKVKRIKPDFSTKKFAEPQPYNHPKILEQIASLLQKAGLN
jgi:hypothetical protein